MENRLNRSACSRVQAWITACSVNVIGGSVEVPMPRGRPRTACFVIDRQGNEVDVFNLADHDLSDTDEFAALEAILLDVAGLETE